MSIASTGSDPSVGPGPGLVEDVRITPFEEAVGDLPEPDGGFG
ncbi:MAG: hypothetical protein PVTTEEND_001767, partial [Candidatus Fervidibacter sp.]